MSISLNIPVHRRPPITLSPTYSTLLQLELSHGLAGTDPDRPETLLALASREVVAAAAAAAGARVGDGDTASVSLRAWRTDGVDAVAPGWLELVE